MSQPEKYLERVADVLFPNGELDHEWSVADLETIAELILAWKDGVPA